MTSPGRPPPGTIVIDTKTYHLAQDKNGFLHETVAIGQDKKEEFDFTLPSLGMGETVKQTDRGYFFTEGIERTGRGLRLAPTVTVTGGLSGTMFGLFFEEDDANAVPYVYYSRKTSATNLRISKIRASDDAILNVRDFTIAGATNIDTKRPAKFNGLWFHCIDIEGANSASALMRLSTVAAVTTKTITDISVANPTVITAAGHGLTTGMTVTITGSNSTPSINGVRVITKLTDDTFTVPVNVTVQGTAGTVTYTADDTWTAHDTVIGGLRGLFVIDQVEANAARMGRISGAGAANLVYTLLTNTTTAPLVEANWAQAGVVGDISGGFAHSYASHAGVTMIAKGNGVYAWDSGGNTYALISYLSGNPGTGLQTGEFGLVGRGDTAFWASDWGLFRIQGRQITPNIGVDGIPYYQSVPNITAPIRQYYFEGVTHGDWLYYIYAPTFFNSSACYLMAARLKRHPATGLPVQWHTVLKRSVQMHHLFIDSAQRLRWSELDEGNIAHIQLAADGSPDSASRGNVSSTYEDYEAETDFGLPEITKQMRYVFVETEGGNAEVSWQLKCHRDSGAAESVGSAITTAAATNINWAVGTNDTCRRLRLRFTATTTAGYAPASTDSRVLRATVYARSADRMRVVLTDGPQAQRSHFDNAKILRKLKNAGPVTIREPGTNENFTGYIQGVNEIRVDGKPALEIVYDRFTVAA